MIHKKVWSITITMLIAIIAIAPTGAPDLSAASPNDSDDTKVTVAGDEQLLPEGFEVRVKGDEQQLPEGFEVRVKGDEQLLDSVWDKVESSITDMPEDAVLTAKYVTTPPQTCRSKLQGKHCCYRFEHLVDGEFVDGDKFIVVIDADTLERRQVLFHIPLGVNGVSSIEKWRASARPIIWDGSRPTIRIGPFYASPASCSYRGPGYYNDLNNHRSYNDFRKTE